MTLILASQSPRRRELLADAQIEHSVRFADVDETVLSNELALDYVRRIAREKALAIDCAPDEIVLAADTTVLVGKQILGKPADDADAIRMLQLLAGKEHEVITGICLRYLDGLKVFHETTRVWFTPLAPETIRAYVATGEPAGKAGAYAIQGIASRYVERIDGSYSNVVGLPVALVWRELSRLRTSLF